MVELGVGLWIGGNTLFVLVLVAASWITPKRCQPDTARMIDVTRLLRGAARAELFKLEASQGPPAARLRVALQAADPAHHAARLGHRSARPSG